MPGMGQQHAPTRLVDMFVGVEPGTEAAGDGLTGVGRTKDGRQTGAQL